MLPRLNIDEVYHVGHLEGSPGPRNTYEGGLGISVSVDPHGWVREARLGGKPIWVLRKPGGVFVDMLEVDRSRYIGSSGDKWGLEGWEKQVSLEALGAGFDGLWWSERLQRGVIFDSKVPSWQTTGGVSEHVSRLIRPQSIVSDARPR